MEEAKNVDWVECAEGEANCHSWGIREANGEVTLMHFKMREPEAHELRIKVLHVGICMQDISQMKGEWERPNYPLVPGHEIVGRVEIRGSDAKLFKIGEIVIFGGNSNCCGECEMCRKGKEGLCSGGLITTKGGYSTIFQGPEEYFFKLPENIPACKAAPLVCVGTAVYTPLSKLGGNGLKVGIVGVGGAGHLGVQFAVKLGYKVYALSSDPEKEEHIKELGAHRFILTTSSKAMTALSYEGLNLIINTTPVHDIDPYLRCLAPTGTFVQIGIPPPGANLNFQFYEFVLDQKNFVGGYGSSRLDTQRTLDFAALHHVVPVTLNYPWGQLHDAILKLKEGKPRFRCILDVEDLDS